MDVFDLFESTAYTFLELDQVVDGNVIQSQTDATGVLKIRDGMLQADNVESVQSDATLHVRPTEAFIDAVGGNMVGHGIRASKNGSDVQDYRIIGQVEGYNFDDNVLEFYRLTLKRESIAE